MRKKNQKKFIYSLNTDIKFDKYYFFNFLNYKRYGIFFKK